MTTKVTITNQGPKPINVYVKNPNNVSALAYQTIQPNESIEKYVYDVQSIEIKEHE